MSLNSQTMKVVDQISASAIIQDVESSGPFLLSLLVEPGEAHAATPATSTILVSSPDDLRPVQTIKIPDKMQPRSIAQAGQASAVVVGKDDQGERIDLLLSKSLTELVDELENEGKWNTAIRIARRSEEQLDPGRMHILACLRAIDLLAKQSFDSAIDLLIREDVNPAKVVALFDSLVSGPLHVEESKRGQLFGLQDDAETHSGSLTSPDDREGSVRSTRPESLNGSTKQMFNKSVDVLIRYLTDRRQKYAQAFAAMLPSSRPSPAKPPPLWNNSQLLKIADQPLSKLSADELAQIAQVVDTTLFRCYLRTKPVLVGPLSRIENWCNVEEVEDLLLEAKKSRELLDMYRGKSMHSKALQLLKRQSEEEDDPKEQVAPTVEYLQRLGAQHIDLIFESARWVIEKDAEAGLQIFIAESAEVESLPRHDCMQFLAGVNAQLCERYLEHIIQALGEAGTDFHEKLIALYLDDLAKGGSESTTAHTKLERVLETSQSYRPERILARLPSDSSFNLRAIVLGRLGRHEGALQLYVQQMKDTKSAERYCSRIAKQDPEQGATVFLMLLKLYLRPQSKDHEVLYEAALSLISSHASAFDTIEVLDLLPPLVSLAEIRAFLEKCLRQSRQKARERVMVRSVAKALLEAQERDVVALEERRVKITESRICPQCHRRLGTSVIAIHAPLGEVTHYQCRDKYLEAKRQAASKA